MAYLIDPPAISATVWVVSAALAALLIILPTLFDRKIRWK